MPTISTDIIATPLDYTHQVDTFLRDNLDWMGRASNWAKFTATASIGVVHRGHMKESMSLLQPYLPQGGVSALPYSEGGALYALGLIHSNKGSDGNAEVDIIYYYEHWRAENMANWYIAYTLVLVPAANTRMIC